MPSPEQIAQLEYNIHLLVKPLFTAVSMYYTVGLSHRSKHRGVKKYVNTGVNWYIPHVLHIALNRLGIEHYIFEKEEKIIDGTKRYHKYLRVNCKQLKQVGEEEFMKTVREVLKDIYYSKITIKRGEYPWREKTAGSSGQ
ncbi:MAG: hypothetical protein ACPLRJ_07865 [Infirmifilum uzonense]|uniref:hypothetical protein n=1 Tax=Infirmifilum uzonense TaxID=1550241 RepID=UPI003C75F748